MTNLNVNRPPLGGLPPVNLPKLPDGFKPNPPVGAPIKLVRPPVSPNGPIKVGPPITPKIDNLGNRQASGIENKNHTQSNIETMKASAPMVAAPKKTPEDRFNDINTPIEERRELFEEALYGENDIDLSTCNLRGLEKEADEAVWELTEKFVSAYREDSDSDETEELQQSLQDLYKNPTLSGQSKNVIEKCMVLLAKTEDIDYEDVLPEVAEAIEERQEDNEILDAHEASIREGMKLHEPTADAIRPYKEEKAKKFEEKRKEAIESAKARSYMEKLAVDSRYQNALESGLVAERLEGEAFEKGIAEKFPEAFSSERLSHPKYAKQLKSAISEAFDAKIEIRHLEADIRRLQRGDALLRDESQVQAMRNKLLAKKWPTPKEEQTLKELNNIPETLAKNTAKLEEAKKQLEAAKLAASNKMQSVKDIIQKGPDPNDRFTGTVETHTFTSEGKKVSREEI